MNRSMHLAVLAALVTLGLSVGSAAANNNIILPRAGQVGIGVQVQGGTLLTSGDLGSEFGAGAGITVNVRYRMRFERAFGLTFGSQGLSARNNSGRAGAFDALLDAPLVLRDKLKLNTAGVEFYQLFDTRERTTKMLSAGAGLVQMSAHLTNGETQFPIAGDGIYLSLGAGFERFMFKSWAWDLGSHYMAIFHDGKMNHDVQLQTGLIFYAAY